MSILNCHWIFKTYPDCFGFVMVSFVILSWNFYLSFSWMTMKVELKNTLPWVLFWLLLTGKLIQRNGHWWQGMLFVWITFFCVVCLFTKNLDHKNSWVMMHLPYWGIVYSDFWGSSYHFNAILQIPYLFVFFFFLVCIEQRMGQYGWRGLGV